MIHASKQALGGEIVDQEEIEFGPERINRWCGDCRGMPDVIPYLQIQIIVKLKAVLVCRDIGKIFGQNL